MAHLDTTYASFETFLNQSDAVWTVDLTALNSSGVSGSAILAVNTEEDGSRYLNVAVTATGLTPNETHVQHVHGLFDEAGNPIDSVTPTIADDADRDGMVEVLEGVGRYGDVLLPLDDMMDNMPMADENGLVSFIQAYELGDASNFFSPVTGTDYTADDVLPLDLREVVLHGVAVPDGTGEGTDGEVNGGENGYIPILPAAAGTIESSSLGAALDLLGQQRALASNELIGDDAANVLAGGAGEDRVIGNGGNDDLSGAGGSDFLAGVAGDDVASGGEGNDTVFGGAGEDSLTGDAGNDKLYGVTGNDMVSGGAGDDTVFGGAGEDMVTGGDGDDMIFAGAGNDTADGGAGNDTIFSGSGDDQLFGQGGDDELHGLGGDDLLVGGDGNDMIFGGTGADIIGGLGGDDVIRGGDGRDEFHFDAGTGTDRMADFVQGEDVISLLDGGAIDFANSTENDTRGDSDLSQDDFATVLAVAGLTSGDDSKVIYSEGGRADAEAGTGDAIAAWLATTDGTDSFLYFDDDWSDTEGRELVGVVDGLSGPMTAADFDVY